jgi:UDP-N-acetylglucosamine/UDP-N-acetylgalactosamine diphosphorylase
MFEVGPVRKRSLLQLHAEKIIALRKRYDAGIPWVVMTSDATDAATRAFFEEMLQFGLGEDTVRFCKQENMPALARDGKLLLETKSSLSLSPNGHGGSIKAIHDSGCLAWLKSQGVDTVFYFQVDNVLVRICDPVFIGYHLQAKAEMSSKVCRKRDWREKVGVVGYVNGKLSVIEYSDLPEDLAKLAGPDGSLKWWAGSIAIHVLDVAFLERLNAGGFKLPYHRAEKAITCVGADGQPVKLKTGEKNGIKFETFIFDALPMTNSSVTVETDRALDFAPIKNATGEDSPETARNMLMGLWAAWLEKAGRKVPRKPDGSLDCRIDISPLTSMEGEHLQMVKIGEIKPGSDVVV